MKIMSYKMLFRIGFAIILVVNVLFLFKVDLLNKELQVAYDQSSSRLRSERSIMDLFEMSLNLSGEELQIANIPLTENLTHDNINPVLIIDKDMCETCKDKMLTDLDNLFKDGLSLFSSLNIILLDESSESIGSGMYDFYSERSYSLHFIKKNELRLKNGSMLPKVFLAFVNNDLQIVSSCEFDIKKPHLFSVYARILNKKIDM